MRKEYDFSAGKANPYAKRLKKQITIRLDQSVLEYFKGVSEQVDIPYQTLINLYLRDCATSGRVPEIHWEPEDDSDAAQQSVAADGASPRS